METKIQISEANENLKDEPIKLEITYNCENIKDMRSCNLSDIAEDVLKKFAIKIEVNYSSIYFLYDGKKLEQEDLKKKISQIINSIDKERKAMNILVCDLVTSTIHKVDKFRINLLNNNKDPIIIEGDKSQTFEKIFADNIENIGTGLNSLNFVHCESEIDLNAKFDDVANDNEKANSMITIYLNPISNLTCGKRKKCIICISIIVGIILLIALGIIIYLKVKPDENKTCEEGYFIPDDYTNCKKCSLEGCKKCKGSLYNNECLDCGDLIALKQNNKLIKCEEAIPETEIIECEDGYFIPNGYESCQKCSLDGCKKCKGSLYNNECLECKGSTTIIRNNKIIFCNNCNEGYFVPDDRTTCQKCSLDGCIKCNGTYSTNQCTDCGDLIPIKKNGKITKCVKCDEEGYFIPDNEKICEKCSMDGCKKCKGNLNNDECLECSGSTTIIRNEKIISCKNCNKGYFIPDDDTNCKNCTINGCKECKGSSNDIECADCGDLIPIKINGKIKQCISCGDGYFVPDNGTNCQKCSLDGCKKCKGSLYNNECLECKGSINIIRNNKIILCNNCNEGYFVPDDRTTCKKCSLDGCIKCNGTYSTNQCTDCGDLESVYLNGKIIACNNTCETGLEEKCLSCHKSKIECTSCNIGYKLVNGKCKPDFFIKAIYDVKKTGYWDLFYASKIYFTQLIIDGKNITNIEKSYYFETIGEHIAYFKFRMTGGSSSNMNSLFYENEYLKTVVFSSFDEGLSNNKHPDFSFSSAFQNCKNLISVDFSKIVYKYESRLTNLFNGCTNLLYVNLNLKNKIKVTSAEYIFKNCESLVSIDLSNLDVSKVTSLNGMFYGCKSLVSIDLSMLNVENVNDFSYLFYDCISLQSINIKNWRTKSATNLHSMFYNCNSLKYLDLSTITPAEPMSINRVFYNCYSLTSINLNNTKIVKGLEFLFYNCSSLKEIDLSSFIISQKNGDYTTLDGMFRQCKSLTSIIFGDEFLTNGVSLFTNMFANCSSLTNIDISNFRIKTGSNIQGMFMGCYSLTSISFQKSLARLSVYSSLFFDCPNLTYVNFSFVSKESSYSSIFNKNISDHGIIVLNYDFYDKVYKNHIPSGWNVTFE